MADAGKKKTAGILMAIGAVLLLFSAYIALVYHGSIDAGASWVIALSFQAWIVTFFIIFLILALILVVLLVAGGEAEREQRPEEEPEIDVTCANCARSYVVTDTGDRPLYHSCPYCGHSDAYDETPEVVEAEPEEELVPGTIRETPEGERELILRCSDCRHVFPTAYTDDRPLYAYCPNCGKKGVLTEPAPGGPGGGEEDDTIETELADEAEPNVPSVDEDERDEASASGA